MDATRLEVAVGRDLPACRHAVPAYDDQAPISYWKMKLPVRVGMDTEPVVIREGGELYDDTPNVAAQVHELADPDPVLVTAATYRPVAALSLVEERGPQALKGVRGPVALYRVVRPSGLRSRLRPRACSA